MTHTLLLCGPRIDGQHTLSKSLAVDDSKHTQRFCSRTVCAKQYKKLDRSQLLHVHPSIAMADYGLPSATEPLTLPCSVDSQTPLMPISPLCSEELHYAIEDPRTAMSRAEQVR
jgi:hypothetical protein